MSHFEPGELALPIHKILWAPTNSAHYNHLHVEGYPPMSQSELPTNGIWTDSIGHIFDALDAEYGAGEHFIIDPDAAWTHMGVYNPRYIAGTTTWSQHAGANAIDIGPYYGVEEQQKFYDFLTRKEGEDVLTQEDKDWIMAAIRGDNVDQTDSVWKRYVIKDSAGAQVPLLNAIQFIYRKLEQGQTVEVDTSSVAADLLSQIRLVQE